jgi:uncharacterized membrane protein YbhN (UPF0104 family)
VEGSGPRFTVTEIEQPPMELPDEADPRRIGRRAAIAVALLLILLLVVVLAPGLDHVRRDVADAKPGWIALAVALEFLSCVSYVVMFRPIFCDRMTWRTASELAWSELAMGSIVPASGAGGLALGAWALARSGMPGSVIARRSVAFFLIKSSVNFVAVAVIGVAMALGLGPHKSLWLTLVPAAAALLIVAAVATVARLGEVPVPGDDAGRTGRALAHVRNALIGGVREAGAIIKKREPLVIVGALGYWVFDNAVIWATFHAVGVSPPLTVILMGYLIGQLGGALPLPGGIGGIDGGLLGTLIVYGTPAAATAAAVLIYRLILFWLPLLIGSVAFISLRRGLNDPSRPDLCVSVNTPATATG